MKNKNINVALCVLSDVLKKWQLILFAVLLCGFSFDLYKTTTYKPAYSSTVTVSLTTKDNSYTNLEQVKAYISTLEYIMNGDVVKDYVKEESNIYNLNYKCSITSISDTNILNINITSPTKKEAYFTSKYVVEWYKKNIEKFNFKYNMDITNSASIAATPTSINIHKSNLKKAGFFVGVFVVALIGLFSFFSNRIKDAGDIEKHIDSRLLRKIPCEIKPRGRKFWKKNKKAILISSIQVSFPYREAMKKLRTYIEESSKKHNYKTIMITSALENEGKSSIATNLAIALASKDYKVLLVDADIRKPSMYKIFEHDTKYNFNNYLKGHDTWQSQVKYLQKEKLSVLFMEQDLEHAEELIESSHLQKFFDEVKEEYDFVIVDSSPACHLNEPLVLNQFIDATAVVVKQNVASYKLINNTIHRLVNVNNNVIGCIYNASYQDTIHKSGSYGYHYGYGRYQHGERRR